MTDEHDIPEVDPGANEPNIPPDDSPFEVPDLDYVEEGLDPDGWERR